MARVSVIIATHSRPHLLPRAVESARSAGKDVEVVVVDDASTDETAQVCRDLPISHYVRVESNRRVAGARNAGIVHSTGEYLNFLDDDDVRLAGTLDRQVEALSASPEAGMIYGQALIADQSGDHTSDFYPERCPQGDVFTELLVQNFIPCGTVVFRRACLLRAGLLDPAIAGIDDLDLWLRIASLCPVLSLEQPVMVWRRSTPISGQGTSRHAELLTLSAQVFEERWLRLPRAQSLAPDERRKIRRRFYHRVADQLVWEASQAWKAGHRRHAGKQLLTGLRLCPRGLARHLFRAKTFRFLLSDAGQRHSVRPREVGHISEGRSEMLNR